jgi:tRNA pseudouridine55 synthase
VSTHRSSARRIDGVLLLDKPSGITSQTAVSRVKRLFSAAKAGHTGTLDPLADGLLPVCIGEATKFSQALLDADKGYRATVRLGVTTTTGDLEGDVIAQNEARVTLAAVSEALGRFRGDIVQVPPMYSALKKDGRPLYDYARAGETVERTARTVHVSRLDLIGAELPDVDILVICSKGTYVRTLAEDLGKALGCGACLARLRRISVGRFSVDEAVGFGVLEGMEGSSRLSTLRPVDALLADWPRLDLSAVESARLRLGQSFVRDRPAMAPAQGRAYASDGSFLGVVEIREGGLIVPRRLVCCAPAPGAAAAQAAPKLEKTRG